MATFEQRKIEIASAYAAAAASQNHRLFREAMKDHQELVLGGEGNADELLEALRSSGQRILGKSIMAETIDELVDLVSSMREDMTDSQRLSVFMEKLLQPRTTEAPEPRRNWPEPSRVSQRGIARFTKRDRMTSRTRREIDFEDIDMTPNRSIGGAAWAVGLVLLAGGGIAGVLYLINIAG